MVAEGALGRFEAVAREHAVARRRLASGKSEVLRRVARSRGGCQNS